MPDNAHFQAPLSSIGSIAPAPTSTFSHADVVSPAFTPTLLQPLPRVFSNTPRKTFQVSQDSPWIHSSWPKATKKFLKSAC